MAPVASKAYFEPSLGKYSAIEKEKRDLDGEYGSIVCYCGDDVGLKDNQ